MDKELCKQERGKVAKDEANEPVLRFKFERDEATGYQVLKEYELSDGTTLQNLNKENAEKFLRAFRTTTGSENLNYAVQVIALISSGVDKKTAKDRFDYIALMLGTLKPQDEIEALLLGQFITLQDAAMKCLSQFNDQEYFYHKERFLMLATKVFSQTNAVMQTLMKYRTGGKQIVQILHVHNEGQAVVNQSVSN